MTLQLLMLRDLQNADANANPNLRFLISFAMNWEDNCVIEESCRQTLHELEQNWVNH